MLKVTDKLIEQLLYEEESTAIDFKSKQYLFINANDRQKSELLKDIIAFANAWRRSDSFILIGVEEVKGSQNKVIGIAEHIDDAQIQQFVNSKTQRPVDFGYIPYEFKGSKIAVIWIPLQERPIYLVKDYGKLNKNTVYIRRGTSTDEASPDEVKRMVIDSIETAFKHEPVMKLAFSLPNNTDTDHLLVEAIADFSKDEVKNILQSIIVSQEEIKLIEKYDSEISLIEDRYPDGKAFYPYGLKKVIEHNNKFAEAIALIDNNFKEFEFHKELFARAIEMANSITAKRREHLGKNPAYVKIKISNEDGNRPAENVVVYIYSGEKVRFLSRDDARKTNIRIKDGLPEDIEHTVKAARTFSEGKDYAIETMFERRRGRKFNPMIDLTYNLDLIRSPFANAPQKKTHDVSDGKLRIFIEDGIRHKHFIIRKCEGIYLCTSLKKGEKEQIYYECHADNLPEPAKGYLTVEGN